jgi:hypothetical protein
VNETLTFCIFTGICPSLLLILSGGRRSHAKVSAAVTINCILLKGLILNFKLKDIFLAALELVVHMEKVQVANLM